VVNLLEFGFIDKTMRVQEKVKKHKDNFNKKEGILLSDNKQDEMMANVLDLYPKQTSYLLMGESGAKKRTELQKEVRAYFDKLQDDDTALSASGGRRRDRKGLKKVGRTIARATLAIPRGAALAIIRLNFRGSAKRFDLLNAQGEEKLMMKWENLGGKRDALNRAIDAGKDKTILLCGKKCRAKAGSNPKIEGAYENAEPASTTSLVVAGGSIVAALIGTIGSGVNSTKNYKNTRDLMKLEASINQKEREENAIDATMTPSEKKIAEEIIKAQDAGSDPIQAIKNNTNLTAEEKAEAIRQLELIEKSNIGIDTSKKFILLGILLVAGFLGWSYYKNKQTNS
jgi:hypothetical protein